MSAALRIVHWGKYYPPDPGGIESVTATVARGSATAGYHVTVVCFSSNRALATEMLDGVNVLRAPQAALLASQPLGWTYLRVALREARGAHLVHVHVPNMLGALATVLLGRGPKLLIHWHSDVVGKGILARVLRPLERAMLKRADLVVCTSQAYADSSEALRPFLKKVVSVPIGIRDIARPLDTPALPELLAGKLQGRRLILSAGRLVPYKGFDLLIEAAGKLPEDVVVVIVGGGPLRVHLQGLIERFNLNNRVVLTGRISEKDLEALYRRAHLFCLPSVERSEAFGVVLVEAMAYGLPIVATRIAGSAVPWVNEHQFSGLNVPVGDVRSLALACQQILDSPALHDRLAAGARKRFIENFTDTQSNAKMLKHYAVLVGART